MNFSFQILYFLALEVPFGFLKSNLHFSPYNVCFFFKSFSIFIIAALKSLSTLSMVSFISGSVSINCFYFLSWLQITFFFLLLCMSSNFLFYIGHCDYYIVVSGSCSLSSVEFCFGRLSSYLQSAWSLFVLFFLAVLHGTRDLSSLTRDWTHVSCSGSTESQPLDSQGIPSLILSVLVLTALSGSFWNSFYLTASLVPRHDSSEVSTNALGVYSGCSELKFLCTLWALGVV